MNIKIIIGFCIVLLFVTSASLCIEKNHKSCIPISSGNVEYTIWLNNYTYQSIPDHLILYSKIKNMDSKTVEYIEQVSQVTAVNLTYPNGTSREISIWANSTWEPSYGYLKSGEEIKWERMITYNNITPDFFDSSEFTNKGTYKIYSHYHTLKSNTIEINIE